jgi:thioredoxin-related protein
MTKKITLSILLIFTLITVNAQEWLTDLNEAQKIAAEKNQHIILVFQGSDWCAPCIKLNTEIWSTPEFINYSKDHYVMLKADFPRKSKNKLTNEQQEKNNKLAEKYNIQGYFPYVVVLDKSGKILGSTGYKKVSPTEYIEILNSF